MTQEQEHRLAEKIRNDPVYQELLRQCEQAETEYLRIRSSLPEKDGILLERYIVLCEELDHRRLFLAVNAETNG